MMWAGCMRARRVVTRSDGGFDSRPALLGTGPYAVQEQTPRIRLTCPLQLATLYSACHTPQRRPGRVLSPDGCAHRSSGPPILRGIGSDTGVVPAAGTCRSADPNVLPSARTAVLGHDGAGHRHGGLGYSLPGECAPLPQACRRHPCSGASALQRREDDGHSAVLTRSLLKRDDVQSRAARLALQGSPYRRGDRIARHIQPRRSVVHVKLGGST